MELKQIIDRRAGPAWKDAYEALRRRRNEFNTDLEMQLTAVAMTPDARARLELALDQGWNLETRNTRSMYPEVIIGGGLHAAIYAAVRVQMGHPKPLIIERGRIGGAMAMSRRGSFWLNSRNRPGPSGLPGESRGLNHVPGAIVQVENFTGQEFVDNTDLAYVARTSIAQHAIVRRGVGVRGCKLSGVSTGAFGIELEDGSVVYANRVLDARGFGDHRDLASCDGQTVMSSQQFMTKMDEDFPLHDMGRIAVVGNGNSAFCVCEALLQMGPNTHMSVPRLDWIEQVDLYGPDLPTECEKWRAAIRGRYQGLGSMLRPLSNGRKRLRVFRQRATWSKGYKMCYVNERPYETVILATGWRRPTLGGIFISGREFIPFESAPIIARHYPGIECWQIGPAAAIPFSERENDRTTSKVEDNKDALFRLGNYTAQLAANLPPV